MCCCGKPNVNGQPGYSWDGKSFSTRPVNPPELLEGDELLYDEPGRCGGVDCHAYHFRIVKRTYYLALLVRHGGGDESFDLSFTVAKNMLPSLAAMDSNARYWLMHTIYSAARDAADKATEKQRAFWRTAAAEKRIKTRKVNRGVKVWVEDKPTVLAA